VKSRGFTLIEVVVALFIVALAVGALLGAVTSSASNTTYLRDKTFAEWVALNKLTETRVAGQTPSRGATTGEVDYAGNRYQWQQTVSPLPFNGMFKIEVRARMLSQAAAAAPPAATASADAAEGDGVAWTATAVGVVSTSVAIARTPVVDWGEPQAGAPGSPNNSPGTPSTNPATPPSPGTPSPNPGMPVPQPSIPGSNTSSVETVP
jgi:general secretion pathway protein I